jgi:hypothetical protein|tara:strand:- start:130 stop:414 length:285 start_codon:yes stop_codon:yes gene_type:complete
MTIKKLLAALFGLMEDIASGAGEIADLPKSDKFLTRIRMACAICTDSEQDIRVMLRKMSAVAASVAKVCESGDAQGWRNASADMTEANGFVRRR